MNGLTEISTQYAGLEMDYKLILTVMGQTVNFKVITQRITPRPLEGPRCPLP